MALDPGAEIDGGMLMAVLIRLAERMVQLESRGQRRERDQGKPQQRNNEEYGKAFRHTRAKGLYHTML